MGPFLWENPSTPDKLPLLSGVSLTERKEIYYVKASAVHKRPYLDFSSLGSFEDVLDVSQGNAGIETSESGDAVQEREKTQGWEGLPSALELRYRE